MPRNMPPPGYAGHLHRTTDSVEAYGTSRWQPAVPISHAPKILAEDRVPVISSGWPLSSGVADPTPVGGRSAAAVGSRYAATIATLGNF